MLEVYLSPTFVPTLLPRAEHFLRRGSWRQTEAVCTQQFQPAPQLYHLFRHAKGREDQSHLRVAGCSALDADDALKEPR